MINESRLDSIISESIDKMLVNEAWYNNQQDFMKIAKVVGTNAAKAIIAAGLGAAVLAAIDRGAEKEYQNNLQRNTYVNQQQHDNGQTTPVMNNDGKIYNQY